MTSKRRGVEGWPIVEGDAASERTPERPLVNLLGRAHADLAAPTNGQAADTAELTALYGVHRAAVSRVRPLAFPAPGITEAILTGRQPVELSARKLSRQIGLPIAWGNRSNH